MGCGCRHEELDDDRHAVSAAWHVDMAIRRLRMVGDAGADAVALLKEVADLLPEPKGHT